MAAKALTELVFHSRSKERLFGRPATLESRFYRAFWNSADFSLILQTGWSSKYGEVFVASGISGLLRAGRPIAIILRVVPVVVSTLKTKPAWPLSHIREEVFKGLPSFANQNPPASIIPEIGTVGVAASLSHSFPNPVLLGIGASVRFARERKGVPSVASARFCIPAHKKPVCYRKHLAAIASANAGASVVFGLPLSDDNQSCKLGPFRDMNFLRHDEFGSLCSAAGDEIKPSSLAAKLTNLPQQASAMWN